MQNTQYKTKIDRRQVLCIMVATHKGGGNGQPTTIILAHVHQGLISIKLVLCIQ